MFPLSAFKAPSGLQNHHHGTGRASIEFIQGANCCSRSADRQPAAPKNQGKLILKASRMPVKKKKNFV